LHGVGASHTRGGCVSHAQRVRVSRGGCGPHAGRVRVTAGACPTRGAGACPTRGVCAAATATPRSPHPRPLLPLPADCIAIVDAVKAAGVMLAVGHVLRYTAYMQRIIALLRSGVIGEVVNIQHLEPIGWYHFAHS
jgi:hypothetical protein